jgi:hypothetical protein
MRLPELVDHTHLWLSMAHTTVATFGRSLREARLISVGTTGGGAADMTDDDKISLFVAVLGCGTARTCSKDLPALLALAPSNIEPVSEIANPPFYSQPDLKSALRMMFRDIRAGNIDKWRLQMEHELNAKGLTTTAVAVDLMVFFEIDRNHVRIDLRANSSFGKTDKTKMSVGIEMEFGAARPDAVAGYSRRFHEINYERLAGWGTCLTET